METLWSRRSWSNLPVIVAVLFLIQPRPSSAQLTASTSVAVPTSSPLQTSTTPPSSTSSPISPTSISSSPVTSGALPSRTPASSTASLRTVFFSTSLSDPSPTNTDGIGDDDSAEDLSVNSHAFNYYFLIVAVAAVFICTACLYYGRFRKRKIAQTQAAHVSAAAANIGWGSRIRRRNRSASIHSEIPEGLNERGEAPPPYKPRPSTSRRPSLSGGHAVDLEMGRVERDGPEPPRYQENTTSENGYYNELLRPRPVVVTQGRFGSMRRILSGIRGSHT